jgi:hypothetical protein
MSNPYRYPEVGHVFRQCLVCKKTFRVLKSRLVRRGWGSFCTNKWRFKAWHLFSEMLADGRLEALLKELATQDQKKAA